ncbi:type VI secretion system ATPase TssH [soil metagenome]
MPATDSRRISKLLGHLNNHSARALDAAAEMAIARTHFEVGIEHWLLKLIDAGDGDIPHLLRHFRIDVDRVWSALIRNIDTQYRAGHNDTPSFSRTVVELLDEAWRFCVIDLEAPQIRSGALLLAMLSLRGYRLPEGLQVLDTIPVAMLRREFGAWTGRSEESRDTFTPAQGTEVAANEGMHPDSGLATPADTHAGTHPPAASGEPLQLKHARVAEALGKYTVDITQKARSGEIDPVFGREHEVRQMIDILSRRRKNNPILVGEPGVGKTAIVEGLALQIVHGRVPQALYNVELRLLDLGLLQAGASMKGEFESRLRGVIDEVKASSVPVILFIDEAHTLIGAGNAPGAGDAANLLKPALARGELRTIAATTWSEYKKYFERDAALERRFQMVKVDEPDEATAAGMLRGLKHRYEAFHGVAITDDAILTAVKLSMRYIPARQLPDKGVDLIDTASARVKMGHSVPPAVIAEVDARIAGLAREQDALARDVELSQAGVPEQAAQRIAEIDAELAQLDDRAASLRLQHQRELSLLRQLQEAGDALRAASAAPASDAQPANATAELRSRVASLRAELKAAQGEAPLVHLEVDAHSVAQVVADWTGIPAGKMMKDDLLALLTLEDRLSARVIGQPDGIAALAEGIRNARVGLRKKEAPLGVFLLVGPSGVGKTETALALADLLFGGERSMTTINMSEYQEAHTVSQLKGSPPGYVGYGEGGVLTEAVRQRPYGVVLLDEVEKAHRDVMNLFYQVFDRGFMRDGEGREIDFENTVILMTSNLGSQALMECWETHDGVTSAVALEHIRPELVAHFQPALLARMQVVPYLPLDHARLVEIVGLKLARLGERLRSAWRIALHHTDELLYLIADQCHTPDSGARTIDRLIEQTLMPAISRELLTMARDALPVAIFLSGDAQAGVNIEYVYDSGAVASLKATFDADSEKRLADRRAALDKASEVVEAAEPAEAETAATP